MGFLKKLLGGDKTEKAARPEPAPPPAPPAPPRTPRPAVEAPGKAPASSGTPGQAAASSAASGQVPASSATSGQVPASSAGQMPTSSRAPAQMPTSSAALGPVPPGATAPGAADAAAMQDIDEMPAKQLTRLLGGANAAQREAAAARLKGLKDMSAMRPLLNAYLNYGDPGVLDALTVYGASLTPGASRESQDLSIMGQRRARLMDILGVTGDPEAMNPAREWVKADDPDIRSHACAALIRLGDMNGVDFLSHALELSDPILRLKALEQLRQFDIPPAKKAVAEHLDRFLAEGGAVPHKLQVSAPRLAHPEGDFLTHVTNHIKASPHALVIAIGSGAVAFATNRRTDVEGLLEGWETHFTNRRMPPEEQIQHLLAARDSAASGDGRHVVLFGILPSPHDSPPLPHFLVQTGPAYTAKIIVVDPHEFNLIMDWWRYVDDKAQVPTDFEVIISTSTHDKGAISDEEALIYELTPDERKPEFTRALLAHM